MGSIGAEFLVNTLKQHHILFAVGNHLVEALPTIIQDNSLPEIKSTRLHLPSEAQKLGNIVQLIAVEEKLPLGHLERIQCCIVGIHRNSMVETAGLQPLEIVAIRVMSNRLISRIDDGNKFLQHLLIAVAAIPSKAIYLVLPLPLPANTDDGPFFQYVIMGDG